MHYIRIYGPYAIGLFGNALKFGFDAAIYLGTRSHQRMYRGPIFSLDSIRFESNRISIHMDQDYFNHLQKMFGRGYSPSYYEMVVELKIEGEDI